MAACGLLIHCYNQATINHKISTLMMSSALPTALLFFLPSLSLTYAVVLAIFLWVWGEDALGRLLWHTWLQWTLFLAVLAYYTQSMEEEFSVTNVYIAVTAISSTVAVYLLYLTRYQQVQGGPPPSASSANMSNKVVLITGANAGIGKETAKQLFQQGATIIMACRSLERAQAAKNDILQACCTQQQNNNSNNKNHTIHLLELDLSSCRQVRSAVKTLIRTMPKIDVLINNAGIMMGTQVFTEEQHELVMQANYLGHFLLTMLLIQASHLKPQARILNLTSSTYILANKDSKCCFDDIFCQHERTYSLFGQYSVSKLANILFTLSLRKLYAQEYHAFAIHPGLVRTDVVKNMPWYLKYPNQLFAVVLQTLQKTPAQGAWCTVALAMLPIDELERFVQPKSDGATSSSDALLYSSCYWVNRKPQPLQAFAKDPDAMETLWKKSWSLLVLSRKDG